MLDSGSSENKKKTEQTLRGVSVSRAASLLKRFFLWQDRIILILSRFITGDFMSFYTIFLIKLATIQKFNLADEILLAKLPSQAPTCAR